MVGKQFAIIAERLQRTMKRLHRRTHHRACKSIYFKISLMRFAIACLVFRRSSISALVSMRATPFEWFSALSATVNCPVTLLLDIRIRFFDSSADSLAFWSLDEVSSFRSGKTVETESESFLPPLFELSMLIS